MTPVSITPSHAALYSTFVLQISLGNLAARNQNLQTAEIVV